MKKLLLLSVLSLMCGNLYEIKCNEQTRPIEYPLPEESGYLINKLRCDGYKKVVEQFLDGEVSYDGLKEQQYALSVDYHGYVYGDHSKLIEEFVVDGGVHPDFCVSRLDAHTALEKFME